MMEATVEEVQVYLIPLSETPVPNSTEAAHSSGLHNMPISRLIVPIPRHEGEISQPNDFPAN
jgi:hypothetical protein